MLLPLRPPLPLCLLLPQHGRRAVTPACLLTGCKLFACEFAEPLRGAWQPCRSPLLPASRRRGSPELPTCPCPAAAASLCPTHTLEYPRHLGARRTESSRGLLAEDTSPRSGAAGQPPLSPVPVAAAARAGARRTAVWELREALLHFIADLVGCTDLQTPRGAEAGLDLPRALFCTGCDPANAVRPQHRRQRRDASARPPPEAALLNSPRTVLSSFPEEESICFKEVCFALALPQWFSVVFWFCWLGFFLSLLGGTSVLHWACAEGSRQAALRVNAGPGASPCISHGFLSVLVCFFF